MTLSATPVPTCFADPPQRQPRQILLTAAGYYPYGPVAEWVYGNGRLIQRTHNQDYQPGIVQDQNSGGLSLGYEFDPVGNLAKLRRGDSSEPPLRSYGYDALNRLIETRDGATDEVLHAYTYDPTGNRTSATEDSVTTLYSIAPYRQLSARHAPASTTTPIGCRGRAIGASTRSGTYNGEGEQLLRRSVAQDTGLPHDEAGPLPGRISASADNPRPCRSPAQRAPPTHTTSAYSDRIVGRALRNNG